MLFSTKSYGILSQGSGFSDMLMEKIQSNERDLSIVKDIRSRPWKQHYLVNTRSIAIPIVISYMAYELYRVENDQVKVI